MRPFSSISQGMLPWQPILGAKSAKDLHSSLWHSETDWNIAISMDAFYSGNDLATRVKILTSVQ